MPFPFCSQDIITCPKTKSELESNWKILENIRRLFCCAQNTELIVGKVCAEIIVQAGDDRFVLPDGFVMPQSYCNIAIYQNGVRVFHQSQTSQSMYWYYDEITKAIIFKDKLGDIELNLPCYINLEINNVLKICDIFVCPTVTQSC